ncbi:hypothetical protein TNCV_4887121 [Trichonephila clavipes]|nr:hypothetical protein TNCV_4887121 [Trichonephila clavipes]
MMQPEPKNHGGKLARVHAPGELRNKDQIVDVTIPKHQMVSYVRSGESRSGFILQSTSHSFPLNRLRLIEFLGFGSRIARHRLARRLCHGVFEHHQRDLETVMLRRVTPPG